MSSPLKTLAVVSAERGLSVKVLRQAIKRRHLQAHRPGIGPHGWFYVTDFQVDEWLKRRATGGRA